MPRPVLRILLCALLLSALVCTHAGGTVAAPRNGASAPPAPVASVTALMRSAVLLRAGTSRNSPVTPFTPLFTGDRLSTSQSQRAAVLVKDGAQFLLGEQTNLGIDYPVLHLYHGEVFARIPHTNAFHVVVRTDAAVAAVQGTAFDIRVGVAGGRTHTILTVISGSVRLSNRLGSVLVRAGQEASADPNTAPSQPVSVKIGVIIHWTANVSLTTTVDLPRHFPTPRAATLAESAARARLRAHGNDPAALLTLADALFDRGAGSAALATYRHALTALPVDDRARRARAQIGIGSAALTLHDLALADAAALAALALDPRNSDAGILRGDVAEARGDLTGALARFSDLVQADPRDAVALEARCFVLVLLHRLAAARTAAQAVLALQPAKWVRAAAEGDLALIEELEGHTAAELSHALRATAYDPYTPATWINVGTALLELGRYSEALAPLTTASRLGAPFQRATALDDLGLAHTRLGHGAAALRAYAAAWKLDPADLSAAIGVGWGQIDAHQFTAAIATMRRAMTMAPHLINVQVPYVDALYAGHAYGEADVACRAALRDNPNDPTLLEDLAQILTARGDSNGAAQAYQLAYAHRPPPDTADNAWTAGSLAYDVGRLAEARADLTRSVALQPENYWVWVQLALLDVVGNNYQAAIAEARRALALNPDAITAHSVLGLAYLQLDQYDLAAAEERAVLRIDPRQPHAHGDLALIAIHHGDLHTARDEYLAEIRVQGMPYNRDAHATRSLAVDWQGLGLVYSLMHDPTRSLAAYRQAIHIDPTLYSAYDGLAFAQEDLGRYAAALASFGMALRRNPHDVLAYLYRGLLEEQLGQLAAAERDLRQAVALTPDDPSARAALGDVLRLEGRYGEALAQLLQAREQARGTASEAARVWSSLGALYDAMGAYGKAATAYSNALKIDGRDEAARLAYGEDLLQLHRPTEARAQFALVARQDPASTTAYADLAQADVQLGQTSRAIAELRRQIAINHGNRAALAANYRDLGLIYTAHQQWHDAAVALAQAVAFGARTAQDYYDLGYAQARAGERTNALHSLRTAQALSAKQPDLAGKICQELTRLGAGC